MQVPAESHHYVTVVYELCLELGLEVPGVIVERIAAVELYSGIRVIKAFVQERKQLMEFARVNARSKEKSIQSCNHR